jgi:hypothetical protein
LRPGALAIVGSARLRPVGLRRGSLRYDRLAEPKLASPAKAGGARRDRTDDLMLAKHALSQLSYGPEPEDECSLARRAEARANQPAFALWAPARQPSLGSRERRLVGLGRLELPTSRLSSARSNQLSYKPLTLSLSSKRIRDRLARKPALRAPDAIAQARQPLARVRPRRKRNEDGEIPPVELSNPETAGP